MSIVRYEEVPQKEREVIEAVLDAMSEAGQLEIEYRGLHAMAVWTGRLTNGRRLRIMEHWRSPALRLGPLRGVEILAILPSLTERRRREVPMTLIQPDPDGNYEEACHHLKLMIGSCAGMRVA